MALSKVEKRELREIFKSYDKLKVAYLFGSYAINEENKASDIDIGILLDKDFEAMIKVDILTDLAEQGYCNVDLVILNQADPITKYEIVKHNQIIYKRKDFAANSYFSLCIRKYLDLKPLFRVQEKYLKERILNG